MNFQSKFKPNFPCDFFKISECNQAHVLYRTKLIESSKLISYLNMRIFLTIMTHKSNYLWPTFWPSCGSVNYQGLEQRLLETGINRYGRTEIFWTLFFVVDFNIFFWNRNRLVSKSTQKITFKEETLYEKKKMACNKLHLNHHTKQLCLGSFCLVSYLGVYVIFTKIYIRAWEICQKFS